MKWTSSKSGDAWDITPSMGLTDAVLLLVGMTPGLDDVEIADIIGVPAVEVSRVLRFLRDQGLVKISNKEWHMEEMP